MIFCRFPVPGQKAVFRLRQRCFAFIAKTVFNDRPETPCRCIASFHRKNPQKVFLGFAQNRIIAAFNQGMRQQKADQRGTIGQFDGFAQRIGGFLGLAEFQQDLTLKLFEIRIFGFFGDQPVNQFHRRFDLRVPVIGDGARIAPRNAGIRLGIGAQSMLDMVGKRIQLGAHTVMAFIQNRIDFGVF